MTPMGCGLANCGGTASDALVAYYAERAKGGVGLICTAVACINETHGRRSQHQICLTEVEKAASLKKLTEAVHVYGCAIFPQLLHPGVISSNEVNSGNDLLGPSGIASRFIKQRVRAMTIDEIDSLVEDYARGAEIAREAGFDGVEIHAAHHYLLHEFLSPYFNRRNDEYGGNLENRSRILIRIVDKIRERVGTDYPISVRISAEDYMGDSSFHLEEAIKLCRLLENHGVDAISVSAGGTENGRSHSIEPVNYPQGWRRHLARAIRASVKIPIIATTVIRQPAYAEKLLEEGYLDFIGMGRPFLADAHWVRKTESAAENDIRPCISCLRCIDEIKMGHQISCSVNPTCGRELESGWMKADSNGVVCVIGGGPAGMECSRVLAERGFSVVLFEKEDHLGGQMWLAGRAPGKEKMQWFIDYEEQQLQKLGVVIRLNSEPTYEEIRELAPIAVVDGSGAVPHLPDVPGICLSNTTTATEILSGRKKYENCSIVIIGTGLTALETAEYLLKSGNAVTLIGESEGVASGGGNSTRIGDILRQLEICNAVVLTGRRLVRILPDRVVYKKKSTEEEYELPCDAVVVCKGVRANNKVSNLLQNKPFRVLKIGDANRPARILEAVSTGYVTALEIGE